MSFRRNDNKSAHFQYWWNSRAGPCTEPYKTVLNIQITNVELPVFYLTIMLDNWLHTNWTLLRLASCVPYRSHLNLFLHSTVCQIFFLFSIPISPALLLHWFHKSLSHIVTCVILQSACTVTIAQLTLTLRMNEWSQTPLRRAQTTLSFGVTPTLHVSN
jgi:hypothetical protein